MSKRPIALAMVGVLGFFFAHQLPAQEPKKPRPRPVAAAPAAAPAPPWGDELRDVVATPEKLRPIAPRLLELLDWPAPPIGSPPRLVNALYVNAWAFGTRRFYDLVRLADTTEINAFVIDVKDDTGHLTYLSEVPTAILIGANKELRAPDARKRLALLHQHGIYPIARIVVAKDPLLAAKKPAWSVQHREGGLWRDRLNFAWVDAYNDSVWVYAAQLAAEAVQLGFSEVQFDYIRFPDEPKARLATAVFPARRPGETTRDGIKRNLSLLRDRVKSLGVPFTIDIFGMTASADVDLGIGQVWEDLVSRADVVLPMVYPSHYYRGFYGIRHANSEPYAVVRRALQDGLRRSSKVANAADLRPYLQAFTLGRPRYTPEMIREQIRAVEDVGLRSWVLWNPRAVYDPRIFSPNLGRPVVRTASMPVVRLVDQPAVPADSAPAAAVDSAPTVVVDTVPTVVVDSAPTAVVDSALTAAVNAAPMPATDSVPVGSPPGPPPTDSL